MSIKILKRNKIFMRVICLEKISLKREDYY